jgi:hypothetical protein
LGNEELGGPVVMLMLLLIQRKEQIPSMVIKNDLQTSYHIELEKIPFILPKVSIPSFKFDFELRQRSEALSCNERQSFLHVLL